MLLVHKIFVRVVVDAYVYHKYCKSRGHESWDRHPMVGAGGETTSLVRHNSKVSQGRVSILKHALSGDNMSFHFLLWCLCEISIAI